jgi:hypothetical protein
MSFVGGKEEYFGPSGVNYNQWLEVKKLAIAQGFKNISEQVAPDEGHVPMPKEVLIYFNSL